MSFQDQPSRPDWVVLGTPTGDGRVAIYASKELTHAELTRETEQVLDWGGTYRRELTTRIDLTVGLLTYVVVVADTYEQAFRNLFASWSPEPDRAALEPAHRALPAV